MAEQDIFKRYKASLKNQNSVELATMKECFDKFDKNKRNKLDEQQFSEFLDTLFTSVSKPYYIKDTNEEIFKSINRNEPDFINFNEFQVFWNKIVKKIIQPKVALIIVDVQNDFIDGSLAVKNCPNNDGDGAEVVPVINKLIENSKFDLVVYTKDWHPNDHISFHVNLDKHELHSDSPVQSKKSVKIMDMVSFKGPNAEKMEQVLWPAHCIQETKGAELHKDLKRINDSNYELIIKKGKNSKVDSYSAFFDNGKFKKTELDDKLKEHGITTVFVCGIATDFCVAYTAFDALYLNYNVVLIEDACRGVDKNGIEKAKIELRKKGAVIIKSDEVLNLVQVFQ